MMRDNPGAEIRIYNIKTSDTNIYVNYNSQSIGGLRKK